MGDVITKEVDEDAKRRLGIKDEYGLPSKKITFHVHYQTENGTWYTDRGWDTKTTAMQMADLQRRSQGRRAFVVKRVIFDERCDESKSELPDYKVVCIEAHKCEIDCPHKIPHDVIIDWNAREARDTPCSVLDQCSAFSPPATVRCLPTDS